MKPGGSKAKGNRAEREVAALLSDLTNAKWFRVPCSGAIFTTGGDSELKGDVYCKDVHYADVVIEVKNYKSPVTLYDLLSSTSKLSKWLEQLAAERGTNPGLLFFKSSGKLFWYRQSNSTNTTMPFDRLVYILRNISVTYHSFGMLDKALLESYLASKRTKEVANAD